MGQPAAAATTMAPQQRTKGHIYCNTVYCNLKNGCPSKGQSPPKNKKIKKIVKTSAVQKQNFPSIAEQLWQ